MEKIYKNWRRSFKVDVSFEENGGLVSVPDGDFELWFTTDGLRKYVCSRVGETWTNCRLNGDGMSVTCIMERHGLNPGRLKVAYVRQSADPDFEHTRDLTVSILPIWLTTSLDPVGTSVVLTPEEFSYYTKAEVDVLLASLREAEGDDVAALERSIASVASKAVQADWDDNASASPSHVLNRPVERHRVDVPSLGGQPTEMTFTFPVIAGSTIFHVEALGADGSVIDSEVFWLALLSEGKTMGSFTAHAYDDGSGRAWTLTYDGECADMKVWYHQVKSLDEDYRGVTYWPNEATFNGGAGVSGRSGDIAIVGDAPYQKTWMYYEGRWNVLGGTDNYRITDENGNLVIRHRYVTTSNQFTLSGGGEWLRMGRLAALQKLSVGTSGIAGVLEVNGEDVTSLSKLLPLIDPTKNVPRTSVLLRDRVIDTGERSGYLAESVTPSNVWWHGGIDDLRLLVELRGGGEEPLEESLTPCAECVVVVSRTGLESGAERGVAVVGDDLVLGVTLGSTSQAPQVTLWLNELRNWVPITEDAELRVWVMTPLDYMTKMAETHERALAKDLYRTTVGSGEVVTTYDGADYHYVLEDFPGSGDEDVFELEVYLTDGSEERDLLTTYDDGARTGFVGRRFDVWYTPGQDRWEIKKFPASFIYSNRPLKYRLSQLSGVTKSLAEEQARRDNVVSDEERSVGDLVTLWPGCPSRIIRMVSAGDLTFECYGRNGALHKTVSMPAGPSEVRFLVSALDSFVVVNGVLHVFESE